MSEHAEVKQEHTTLADEILFKSGCVSSGSRNPEKLAQLLADHDAEVERQVLEQCCKWHDDNCASGMSARMRAELGGTNG